MVSNIHLRIYSIIFDQENPTQVAPLVYVQDLSRNGVFWNGLKIGKASGGFLLSDGDMVNVCSSVMIEYRGERVLQTTFDQVQIQEMKHFEKQYSITNRTLGCGAYGRVHMSIDKKKKRQLACKIVNLADLKARLRQIEIGKMSQTTVSDTRNKASKQRRLTYRVQAKLGMYDREVEILQKLRHVSEVGTSSQLATAANKTFSPTSSISRKFSRQTIPCECSYVDQDVAKFLRWKQIHISRHCHGRRLILLS